MPLFIFFFLAELAFLSFPASAANGLVYSVSLPSLGDTASTTIAAMTTDSAGNVYVAGSTEDPAFPVTPGVVQPVFGSGTCTYGGLQPQIFICPDAFVMKIDAQGNIVFATYLGGRGFDQATSIGVDAAGNIYVAGITTSFNFPQAAGAQFAGRGPTFLAKLDPAGTTLLYTAFIPGTGDLPFVMPGGPNTPVGSVNIAMTVDQSGNVYFASHGTPGFPVTQNALETSGPIAVGELDPTGSTLLYATYLGGTGSYDSVSGIALDSDGNAYITGSTNSQDFPVTAGAFETSLPEGVTNSFVAKLNATGDALVYSTYFGESPFTRTSQIRVDSLGNVYLLSTSPTAITGFLSELSADGTTLVYSTSLTTTGLPVNALDVDAAGNAYVAGLTGPGFPVSSGALQPGYGGGGDDIFVAEFGPDGSLAAATYVGGSDIENAYAIAAANDGTVALLGLTRSADFPFTQTPPTPPGVYAPVYFISRFSVTSAP